MAPARVPAAPYPLKFVRPGLALFSF